nr:MAG TPA: hypothetical protein [Caudoviricetes sp.]
MGCIEENRACKRLTQKASPPAPLLQRGGVLVTIC